MSIRESAPPSEHPHADELARIDAEIAATWEQMRALEERQAQLSYDRFRIQYVHPTIAFVSLYGRVLHRKDSTRCYQADLPTLASYRHGGASLHLYTEAEAREWVAAGRGRYCGNEGLARPSEVR